MIVAGSGDKRMNKLQAHADNLASTLNNLLVRDAVLFS